MSIMPLQERLEYLKKVNQAIVDTKFELPNTELELMRKSYLLGIQAYETGFIIASVETMMQHAPLTSLPPEVQAYVPRDPNPEFDGSLGIAIVALLALVAWLMMGADCLGGLQ